MNKKLEIISSTTIYKYQIQKALTYVFTVVAFITSMLIGIEGYSQDVLNYDEAIIYADKLLKENKLLDAKAYYQQALKFEPGDKYASEQISIIIDKMQAKMEAEDEYYDIIDLGDNLYEQNKLDAAIIKYKEALKILPDDQYAKDKIEEILDFKSREQELGNIFNKFKGLDLPNWGAVPWLRIHEFCQTYNLNQTLNVFTHNKSQIY